MKLKLFKVCPCGVEHRTIPSTARYIKDEFFGGWYWECSCGSTIFKKEEDEDGNLSQKKLTTKEMKLRYEHAISMCDGMVKMLEEGLSKMPNTPLMKQWRLQDEAVIRAYKKAVSFLKEGPLK